jgi:predicted nuclease of predicted toxin-antitoxin system
VSFALFLDEHIPIDLAELLTKDGFDVLTARDAARANRRKSDEDQLAFATEERRVLVTFNARDFFR